MASMTFDEGAMQLESGGSVNFASDTIEVILTKATYSPTLADTNTVLAAAEISGVSGYAGGYGGAGRKVLASKTKTKDGTLHRIVYDAADPSAWTLGVGDTVGGAIIGKKGSANDTTAVLLFFLDFTDIPTNGSTFTLVFHADGMAYTQQ